MKKRIIEKILYVLLIAKMNKKIKYRFSSSLLAGALMFAMLFSANVANAALIPGGAVGPIVPAGIGKGFPAWYMDQNGLALELMEAADGFGISDPIDPTNNFSQELGFNAEGFWWSADAIPTNTVNSISGEPISGGLVLALEAAFAGEAAVDGEQSAFGRIRYRVDGLIIGETYTVTHPFGTETAVATDSDGNGPKLVGDINVTSDIGCFAVLGIVSCNPNTPPGNPNNFGLVLQSGIGPFLTWDTFNLNPALTDPALINPSNPTKKYIGNPTVEHAIKGGPNGNSFTVTGPGITSFTTNLFTVTGRVAVIDTVAPIINMAPMSATLGSTNVVASMNITDDLGVRTAIVDLGALNNNFSATLNGAQEVPATVSPSTGSGTFVIDTVANTLSFNINSTVTGITGMHIHGSVLPPNGAVGQNSAIAFDLGTTLPAIGTWNYPETMEAEILAGRTYINIHTALFPSGIIRGQILPTADVQPLTMTAGVNTNGTWGIVLPPLTRLGTFNLPITVSDGSNTATGNLVLTVNTLASVSVTPLSATIVGAGTQQLTASPLDNNGVPFVGATVTWSSSNTAVATVDANGLVTGVLSQTPGTATITATATSGTTSVTGTSVISVSPGLPVLTAVNVTPNPASIVVNPLAPAGTTLQLSTSPVDQFGSPFVGATVTWSSSNTVVATVDANGLVTSVTPGQATITATASDGAVVPTTVTGTTIITITTEPQVLTSVSVAPANATLTTGTQQFTATGLDQFSGPMAPQPAFTWSSSNTAIATVDAAGLVTATGAGSATITATSGVLSSTSAITVNAVLTSLTVTPNPSTVILNATKQMIASAMDQFGAVITPTPAVVWSSSNPLIATVDANGLVTGVALGSVTITATSDAVTGTSAVTVVAVPQVLTSVSVNPSNPSIVTEATQQFTASAIDQFGSPMIPQPVFTWTSSNTAVATINASGLVTALTPGTTTISANGEISGNATLTVTLSPAVLTTVSVTPATASVLIGATSQLTANLLDQRNNPIVSANTTTWLSSNPLVATVDANGLITGVASGTATITATNGLKSGQAMITVPTVIPAADLQTVISGGSVFTLPALTPATSTPSVTVALPVDINITGTNGTSTISIPSGTVITKIDGTNLDATALSASIIAASALSNIGNVNVNGSIQWGIPNIGLQFSQPITISIFVGTNLNGQTLNIVRSITGNSTWTSDGIIAPATSVVANGIATFQVTKASFFAATSPNTPAPTNNSGSGGGGGGVRIITPIGQVLGASIENEIEFEGCQGRNTGFSTSSGKSCVGNKIKIEIEFEGCQGRNTGFSTSSGKSCVGNSIGQVLGAEKFIFSLLLKRGSKGNEVMELQKFLSNKGHNVGKIDGKFGLKTKEALIKFQIINKLKGDGIVGPKVRVLLNK